jgi:quercetin dioxygenase-like cupin family protein
VLNLKQEVPGIKAWAVALENTTLTYFEMDPNKRFETHSHESEHITMVIEGELYFDIGGSIISVKPGEVVAFPANEPHGAFTLEKRAKAVEASSPILKK